MHLAQLSQYLLLGTALLAPAVLAGPHSHHKRQKTGCRNGQGDSASGNQPGSYNRPGVQSASMPSMSNVPSGVQNDVVDDDNDSEVPSGFQKDQVDNESSRFEIKQQSRPSQQGGRQTASVRQSQPSQTQQARPAAQTAASNNDDDDSGDSGDTSNSGDTTTPATSGGNSAAGNSQADMLSVMNGLRAGAPALKWDASLASKAQLWADQCTTSHPSLGDPVYGNFGGAAGQCVAPATVFKNGAMMWYNEGPGGGHYDIMTSRTYSKLGCAVSNPQKCPSNSQAVCNFSG